MDWASLIPLLLTGASTGLTCGLSCGACGNPMMNVFLAGYLFTHSGRLKRSLLAFGGYHVGKALTVSALCALISLAGSGIVNDQGELFGVSLHKVVYSVLLLFMLVMIFRWFHERKSSRQHACNGNCCVNQTESKGPAQMFAYGLISGLSPCTSLIVVLGYASALTTAEAILVGLTFSLANSLIPLILLTALTGILSREMSREIPDKVRYFQLAVYILFAISLLRNLLFV